MENNLDLYLKRAGSNKEFQGLMAFVVREGEFNKKLISGPQQKRIFAISGGQETIVRQVLEEYGLTSTSQVPRDKYEGICSKIEKLSKPW